MTKYTPSVEDRVGVASLFSAPLKGLDPTNSFFSATFFYLKFSRFDFERSEWKEVAPMAHKRAWMASIVCSGSLFVFGGHMERGELNSAECYNRSLNQWRNLAPMSHARQGATACALNGFIYVCGGTEEVRAIERYDPQNDTWIEVNYFV